MDRTSCRGFTAKRLTALLPAIAYALLQELRWQAHGSSLARAQEERLLCCLLKPAALQERREVHLSQDALRLAVAGKLGAVATP